MVIFMVITSVFKGASKAPLEVRHAKIALRHWRKCLKHKKLAPSRRKHLRCMPRYAFDASNNEAYTFTWISLPPLSSHLHLCSLTISSLEAWISLSLLRFLLWRLGYFSSPSLPISVSGVDLGRFLFPYPSVPISPCALSFSYLIPYSVLYGKNECLLCVINIIYFLQY